ncbi:ATP-binding protein [Methanosphaerula palustris]|uniref:4Fe-4S ferredoxin iron-sulfur binding domain protein n=1 Tax=Methanosphaerula palustris (strain ATCC BAA-1556 / DSM 19958 / E1-9c) TaxID=521011 RepID=B8GG05_METPE|nr:4Fe-4S binding protein [Methanosphaerula palustris]ACL16079.1 4Fe-4S ferredoxin iron-sulfur binding domain protein [Methanosphaerula palustris E1-9c]
MKRKIITIDEERCTGCGLCIPDCPEGALQIIEGKARLVSDLFCDGLGACIGTCPEGAIRVIEREAGAYDETAVMETIAPQGAAVIKAHLEHLNSHGQIPLYNEAIEYLIEHTIQIPDHQVTKPRAAPAKQTLNSFAGCPGAAARSIEREDQNAGDGKPGGSASELRQWPVQLKLLNPAAPYFDNADLLIAADCVPFAYAGFHQDFLRGKIVIIFCPKLDADIEGYISKLAEILTLHTIPSITVIHMEVPCCSGVKYVVDQALERAGKKVPVKDITISLQGAIL